MWTRRFELHKVLSTAQPQQDCWIDTITIRWERKSVSTNIHSRTRRLINTLQANYWPLIQGMNNIHLAWIRNNVSLWMHAKHCWQVCAQKRLVPSKRAEHFISKYKTVFFSAGHTLAWTMVTSVVMCMPNGQSMGHRLVGEWWWWWLLIIRASLLTAMLSVHCCMDAGKSNHWPSIASSLSLLAGWLHKHTWLVNWLTNRHTSWRHPPPITCRPALPGRCPDEDGKWTNKRIHLPYALDWPI